MNMSKAQRLEAYDLVNQTTSLQDLSLTIIILADKDGLIQGRTRKLNAENMANACRNLDQYPLNMLTREFGIRQQAWFLKQFENYEKV